MKYIVHFRDEKLPISEEEVPKVMKAMETKALVILRCGILNGAFISGITKDINAEMGWNVGYKFKGEDNITRKAYITDLPEKIAELYGGEVIKEIGRGNIIE